TLQRPLQLEVFINGMSTGYVAAFLQEADGRLAAEADQLRNVGVLPAETAKRTDDRIDVSRLPGVSTVYDETTQSVYFTLGADARSTRVSDLSPNAAKRDRPPSQSMPGTLTNYTLFASGGEGQTRLFEGVSAGLESRAFGSFGVLTNASLI